jgi:uncharacterized protein YqgQ
LAPGSEAYNHELELQGRQENDARMQATLAGSQEQQRLFQDAMASRQQGIGEAQAQGNFYNDAAGNTFSQGLAAGQFGNEAQAQRFGQNQAQGQFYNQAQESLFNRGLASSQFSNQARQQALQEADYFKNQPLNMLNALRTGNQVQMPQFQNVSTGAQIQAAPIYQATADSGDYAMKQYQERMKSFGSMLSGLGTLGGAAITKFSDRRLKTDIQAIGRRHGLTEYSFRYLWSKLPEIGFMADEVEKLYPNAILNIAGYKAVNYGLIG